MSVLAEDKKKMQDESKFCYFFTKSQSRFLALFFIVVTAFFYSVNFDMPGPMAVVIERTFSVSISEFELMYSLYTLPNIFLCLASSVMIDKVFGLFRGSVIFGATVLVGQIILTCGSFSMTYWLVLFGRFINGVGAETISLCLNCYAVMWFKGMELNFVFGLFMSITRLGSAFDFLIFTSYYKHMRDVYPPRLVFGMSISPFMVMAVIMVTSLLLLTLMSSWNNKKAIKITKDTVDLKQIFDFPITYWLIVVMLACCNNAVFGFISISEQFFQDKYGVSQESANHISSTFNLIAAVVSPIPGFLVDKFGKDIYFNICGLTIGIVSLIIMTTSSITVWIPLIMYSVFFSMLNSCGWPLIARIVEPYQLATAYGIVQSSINFLATGFNILIGVVLEEYGHGGVSLLLLCVVLIGIICCLVVWILDSLSKGTMNYSASQRKSLAN